MMNKDIILSHYEKLAPNFDRFWRPSNENFDKLVVKIIDLLELKTDDNFLDLGCGTGLYASAISERIVMKSITCVDFSNKMLINSCLDNKIRKIKADIVDFFTNDKIHNKILFKESIHHIRLDNLFFRTLTEKLNNNGIILIVDVDFEANTFPFSDKMRNRDIQYQGVLKKQIDQIKKGNIKVTTEELIVQNSIDKNFFIEKLEKRYISSFSALSDMEIKDEIIYIKRKYENQDDINFDEKYIFYKLSKN